jgi:anti-sigma factor RsiW
MSCDNVQERISSFVDRRLPDAERENVLAHLASCRDCHTYLESIEGVRRGMRDLQRPGVPASVTARLRVLASHEQARRLSRVTFAARLANWSDRLTLAFDNLMRPLAFPFAGGIASALMLFGLVIPTMTFQHAFADQVFFTAPEGDVVALAPSGRYAPSESENPPWIERADASVPEAANVVDLTIDQSGRVCDWTVARGELTPDLTNIIMFGQFSPATNMGIPTLGKVRAVQIRNVQTAPIRVRS